MKNSSLCRYLSSGLDRLDCRCLAMDGQIVKIQEIEHADLITITTPDETIELGLVSQESLFPVPRGYRFDALTGFPLTAIFS